jgi:hypothetical protein
MFLHENGVWMAFQGFHGFRSGYFAVRLGKRYGGDLVNPFGGAYWSGALGRGNDPTPPTHPSASLALELLFPFYNLHRARSSAHLEPRHSSGFVKIFPSFAFIFLIQWCLR